MPVFVCSMSNYRSWSQRKFMIFKQTGCLQPLELVPRLVHLPPSLYLSLHLPLPPLALRDVLTAAMRLATLAAVNLDRPWSLFAQPCCGGDNFLLFHVSASVNAYRKVKGQIFNYAKKVKFQKEKVTHYELSHQQTQKDKEGWRRH